jgi:hypothetical protein
MSFNRWGYTYENPVNLTDPSGHDPWWCEKSPNPAKCYSDWIKTTQINLQQLFGEQCTPPPDFPSITRMAIPPEDPLTPRSSSRKPRSRPYGGEEVMELYQKMKDYLAGWWYGDQNSAPGEKGFDFERFVGLMIIHEGSGLPIFEELVVKIVNQQLYVGGYHSAYCSSRSGCSPNAAANFLGAWSQSVHGLVDDYVRGSKPISKYTGYGGRGSNEQTRLAKDLGHRALYPETLDPRRNDGLSDSWAGMTRLVDRLTASGLQPNTFYPHGKRNEVYYFTAANDGALVFYSVNQWDYWSRELATGKR